MKVPYIIPECYADTNLIGFLLCAEVNHQKGCSQVANTMRKGKNADGFSIGIIDDDKNKPSYIKEFDTIDSSEHIMLLKHTQKAHYFIIIKKAIEDFILSAAKEVNFDLTTIGLKNGLKGLKETTKNCQANDNPKLREAIAKIEDAREMKILKSVLEYLNSNKFNAEKDSLVALFNTHDNASSDNGS